MKVTATLSNVHVSPRKARLVAGLVRGLGVAEARVQLQKSVKKMSDPLAKLLESAVANAENNFSLDKKNLRVVRIDVNEGQKLKRFMPRAQGRATPIWRRLSHVTIVLEGELIEKTTRRASRKKVSTPAEEVSKQDTKKTTKKGATAKIVKKSIDTQTTEQSA